MSEQNIQCLITFECVDKATAEDLANKINLSRVTLYTGNKVLPDAVKLFRCESAGRFVDAFVTTDDTSHLYWDMFSYAEHSHNKIAFIGLQITPEKLDPLDLNELQQTQWVRIRGEGPNEQLVKLVRTFIKVVDLSKFEQRELDRIIEMCSLEGKSDRSVNSCKLFFAGLRHGEGWEERRLCSRIEMGYHPVRPSGNLHLRCMAHLIYLGWTNRNPVREFGVLLRMPSVEYN